MSQRIISINEGEIDMIDERSGCVAKILTTYQVFSSLFISNFSSHLSRVRPVMKTHNIEVMVILCKLYCSHSKIFLFSRNLNNDKPMICNFAIPGQ